MNVTVNRAIDQLKEARETLHRALDDPTLTFAERTLISDAYYEAHHCVLTLSMALARN